MALVYAGTQKAASSWLNVVCRKSGLDVGPRKEWHFWDRAFGVKHPARHDRTDSFQSFLIKASENSFDLPESLHSVAPLPISQAWPSGRRDFIRRGLPRFRQTLRPVDALDQWSGFLAAWQVGDFTPENVLLTEQHWREIEAAVPNLRVIIGVRDPVRRAWSAISMYYRGRRFSDLPSPEEAIAFVEAPVHRQRSFVSMTLRAVRAALPQDRSFSVTVDDIAEDPESVVRRLSEFIGSPLHSVPPVRAPHALPIPPEIEAALEERLLGERKILEELVGRELRA